MLMQTYKSVSAYGRALFGYWWALTVSVASGALGLLQSMTGMEVPAPIWWILSTVFLFVASFLAFNKVRRERDEKQDQLMRLRATPEHTLRGLKEQLRVACAFGRSGEYRTPKLVDVWSITTAGFLYARLGEHFSQKFDALKFDSEVSVPQQEIDAYLEDRCEFLEHLAQTLQESDIPQNWIDLLIDANSIKQSLQIP